MPRQIVVISRHDDPHIPYVQRHLKTKMHCIDASKVIEGIELSYIDSSVIYGDQVFNDVGAVWMRKPVPVDDLHIEVKREYKNYVEESLLRHMNQLKSSFRDAFWLSDPYAITKAGNKVWQMQVANDLGLRTPRTVITSSAEQAKKFITAHQPVIAKPLASTPPMVGKFSMLPAMRFTSAQDKHLTGLHLAPTIFQQLIEAAADIRVNVVGDRVFAAITEDPGVGDGEFTRVRDWRHSQLMGKIKFRPYTLPKETEKQCIAMLKAMNLQFGAIDFVMDKSGKLWFLEINPNGQWAFIEDDTGQPIGKAIAELLESKL